MFVYIFSGTPGEKPKLPDGIPPRFPKKPNIKQEGDDLILECILEANPLPEITWYDSTSAVCLRLHFVCLHFLFIFSH